MLHRWFPRSFVLVLVLLTAFSGCESSRFKGVRTGPPFAEAFPDPSVLLTTSDVDATRQLLRAVILPETREHHDQLRALLDAKDEVDAEHLLLLTEAVAEIEFVRVESWSLVGGLTSSMSVTIELNGEPIVFHPRGASRFASNVDEILLDGTSKIVRPVDRLAFGRLLGRTQSDETLMTIAARLWVDVDDGSPEALRDVLDAIPSSSIRQELVLAYLMPEGYVARDRELIVVEAMGFDSNRSAVIEAILDRRSDVAFAELDAFVSQMSFDSGRAGVVDLAAPKLSSLDGDDLVRAMKWMSFDAGRHAVLERLAPLAHVDSFDGAARVTETFGFDAGKKHALEMLCDESHLELEAADLERVVSMASFDAGKLEALRLVKPILVDGIDATVARKLLENFSFDDGRIEVMRLFREHLEYLAVEDREALLNVFSFDSSRARAREILGI